MLSASEGFVQCCYPRALVLQGLDCLEITFWRSWSWSCQVRSWVLVIIRSCGRQFALLQSITENEIKCAYPNDKHIHVKIHRFILSVHDSPVNDKNI